MIVVHNECINCYRVNNCTGKQLYNERNYYNRLFAYTHSYNKIVKILYSCKKCYVIIDKYLLWTDLQTCIKIDDNGLNG